MVYLNQVLVNVYLLRTHQDSAAFITGYLPGGWFTLAGRNGVIGWVAGWFPDPALLSVTVLRVQAFLELPFVLLAYLTVCRWLGPTVFARARRLIWLGAAGYTITFCLIEWSLRNPFTMQDIAIRLASALIVPPLVRRLSTTEQPDSALAFPAFLVALACLGYLVLIVYDTALLYNLGHLRATLPKIALALLVLAAARLLARHHGASPGPSVTVVTGSFGWFLVLFFAPALPLRYSLNFGLPAITALVALTLAVVLAGCVLLDRSAG